MLVLNGTLASEKNVIAVLQIFFNWSNGSNWYQRKQTWFINVNWYKLMLSYCHLLSSIRYCKIYLIASSFLKNMLSNCQHGLTQIHSWSLHWIVCPRRLLSGIPNSCLWYSLMTGPRVQEIYLSKTLNLTINKASLSRKQGNCLIKVATKVFVKKPLFLFYDNKEKTQRKRKNLHIYLEIWQYLLLFSNIENTSLTD